MKVQEKDLFHGAVLTQIVEDPSFKALNKASPHYGHYLVNTDKQVFVKYRTGGTSPWQFVFSSDELQVIERAEKSGDSLLLCLVCGQVTVCALDASEIKTVLDLAQVRSQWISVEVPSGGSCHVRGSAGSLKRTVPHNAFPGKVFSPTNPA
ncbi:MAG: hypothetical protein ACYC5Q_10600 [Thermoleophilia bacterium]